MFLPWVCMLLNLRDVSKLGPGIALSLISIFYAIILSEIILTPMICMLSEEPKQSHVEEDSPASTVIRRSHLSAKKPVSATIG